MPSSRAMLYTTALAAAVAVSQGARAQDAGTVAPAPASAQPPPQSADSGQGLADIVVTAQKRAENLQRIPIAITAASATDLANRNVNNTTELNAVVPGLNVRTAAGAAQTFIRGIGTTSNVVENPVALYIDGVYLPQQRDGLRELVDVEQVAVLKGPQGTLFGRNATGGVIQITTRAPSHSFSGEARAEIDSYATFRTRAYVTGGLTQKVAASLALGYAHQGDGYGDSITTGNDTNRLRHEFTARAKVLIEADSRTDITVIGDYLDRNQLANSFQPYEGTSLSVPGTGPLTSKYDSYQGADSYIAYHGGGASVTIDHDLDFAKIVSISAYRAGKTQFLFDNAAVPGQLFVVSTTNSPNRMYSQEFQLVSARNDRFNWVTGIYLYDYRNSALPIVRDFRGPLAPAPTSTAHSETTGTELTKSVAPFAQATYEFLPRTNLTVGARYTYEKREASVSQIATRNNGTTATVARNDELTIRKPTFRVAIDHRLTDDVLGYVSFNTGIKSGGFNIINPSPGYLPEKLTAYETGVKSELLGKRLRLNLAAFYYDYKNLQVIQFVGVAQTVVNGAAARLYGLDVDFEAEPVRGLRLSGGLELEHTGFTDYRGAVFSTPRPTGGAVIFSGDATGNRLVLAQEFSGTAAMDYHHSLPRGSLDYNLTANYNGDYYFEADNFLRQRPYTIVNTSLRWTLPDDRISFTLFARNLLDEHVITQSTTQSLGYPTAYSNTPRSVGGAVGIKF
ncbi:TonB-dependent receptor [Sphingomonas bacterium]|uniref:TonB-dependent receptor n=1 Tax=Sphingomonas bacterium TaxID=1895847 RepID=UPI001575B052|nr:TonB-dependent receptor [Sphingomonas bacterium]